ncbi:MAG TPA: HAD-IIB family hydrolase [Spirochaetales bacterium]|nr:HAD-IIB family hydrolase [Spirochaetales bacterium]
MLPLAELSRESLAGVRFVLTDVDDTLTEHGRLEASTYSALWRLRDAGLPVIPITGGPAGWCDLMVRMWPVAAAIAESGAVAYWLEEGTLRSWIWPDAVPVSGSAKLARIAENVVASHPSARLAKNQFCRIYDLAIDVGEEPPRLPPDEVEAIRAIVAASGARMGRSSIHVNVWLGSYDKLAMAERFLSMRYGYDSGRDSASVLYVGDSPNDEPMFRRFPLSVGVANVRRYADSLQHHPKYVTAASHGAGFAELADKILDSKEKR